MSTSKSVFISYARLDGTELAHWLYAQLNTANFIPWLDTSEIRGGAAWSDDIEAAIDGCDVVLALLSHASYRSSICRAEHQRALRKNKPVIPLLITATAERPLYLEGLNYRDFSDREQLETLFPILLNDIQEAITHHTLTNRIGSQQRRIQEGLLEHRDTLRMEGEIYRQTQKRLTVVGQRLANVTHHFQDRAQEQQKISQLLGQPSTRIVSVIGRGGMGKTALVSKILGDLEQNRWPHIVEDQQLIPVEGVAYLSTRTSGISLEQLFSDCVKLIGGKQEEDLRAVWANPHLNTKEKLGRLLAGLEKGLYVILLDNLEDLLTNEGKITDDDLQLFFDMLLVSPCNVRLLVTSRIPIAFRREVMRFDQQVPLIDGLPIKDGIAMLRELDPSGLYGVRDVPDDVLAQIVELVHGVPRALEIVVGILANNPFTDINDLMKNFYAEQDVIENVVHENYRRMDNETRKVMEALAIYGCPVPVVAVDFLLEPIAPGLNVPEIVRQLTYTHIVSLDRVRKTVFLHPIDRDYIYNQLSPIDRQVLEQRAASYYAQLRTPSETWNTYFDLEPILSEFQHHLKASAYTAAAALIDMIDEDYLSVWGYLRRVVVMREALIGHITPPQLLAHNLHRLGVTYFDLGDSQKSIDYLDKALPHIQQIHDQAAEGSVLIHKARAYRNLGKYARAIEYHHQGLPLLRETGQQREESISLNDLGIIHYYQVKYDQAIDYLQQALDISQRISDDAWVGSNLNELSFCYRTTGLCDQAMDYAQRALTSVRNAQDRRSEGYCIRELGLNYYVKGDYAAAIVQQTQAITIAREVNDQRLESSCLGILSRCRLLDGQIDGALDAIQQALDIADSLEVRRLQNIQRSILVEVRLKMQQLSTALEIVEHYFQPDTPQYKRNIAVLHGLVLTRLGDKTKAKAAYQEAIDGANNLLDRTPQFYAARYNLGLAFAGLALVSSPPEIATFLTQSHDAYEAAIKNCDANGVIAYAKQRLANLSDLDENSLLAGVNTVLNR